MPLWKLRRELKRPVDQIRSAVLYPFDLFTKWRHDRGFHAAIKIVQGDQPTTTKFAILLIYQPKGLARTTLLTCQHLLDNGYSVLLVSNAALTDEARAALAPLTWRILERPNIGYDFGGYRDGLRVLAEADVDMQALVVINDSIWWPLCANDIALAQMEQQGADVVGMILRPPGKPRKRATNRGSHLQSYFFWFGPKALASDAFTVFWREYQLSSFKYNAIRHGELRLTEVLMDAGLRVAPLFSFDALVENLQSQPPEYLCKVLRYGTYKDAQLARIGKDLEGADTQDATWRAAVFDLFGQMDKHSEFHLALRFPCVDLLGLNFLKRSTAEPKGSIHHVGRSHYLDAIKNGDVPAPMPEVLAEIQERHRLGAVAVGR
jgi:hypothetical protein